VVDTVEAEEKIHQVDGSERLAVAHVIAKIDPLVSSAVEQKHFSAVECVKSSHIYS